MSPELLLAETLARLAGQAILPFYGRVQAEYKDEDSPVTAADRVANDHIVRGIADRFPLDAILSEESRDSRHRLEAARVWIVDPLDGTREFIAQNGEFSVMIALVEHGQPRVGVVYLPATDVLYSAESGAGAWVQRAGLRQPLNCAPINGAPLRLVGSRSHHDPLLQEMQHALGITDVMPCGSVGVKCALIAEQRRDLYIHPVPYLKEWDTCAPEVVLREAGGSVFDCTGKPLRYNKADPVQPHGMVACAPGDHGRILNCITRLYQAAREPRLSRA
jgi:3'(2'), 5'-bisphosphate nucleotidase